MTPSGECPWAFRSFHLELLISSTDPPPPAFRSFHLELLISSTNPPSFQEFSLGTPPQLILLPSFQEFSLLELLISLTNPPPSALQSYLRCLNSPVVRSMPSSVRWYWMMSWKPAGISPQNCLFCTVLRAPNYRVWPNRLLTRYAFQI